MKLNLKKIGNFNEKKKKLGLDNSLKRKFKHDDIHKDAERLREKN